MKIKWNTSNKNNIHPTKYLKWGDVSINGNNSVVLNYEDNIKKVTIKRKFKNISSALNVMNTLLFRLDLHYRGGDDKKEKEGELLKIFPANPKNWDFSVVYKERKEDE